MELELATVIYELGGSAALYALQKSVFAFPSRTVINHHLRQEYKLRITTGEPRMFDLLENIEIMFKETRPDHFRCGITLSMDEIACDARLCYLAETDNIAGLCEHSAALGSLKMGENLDVSHALCKAIKEGRVHIGQEVFVAAFARMGRTTVHVLFLSCQRASKEHFEILLTLSRSFSKRGDSHRTGRCCTVQSGLLHQMVIQSVDLLCFCIVQYIALRSNTAFGSILAHSLA
jgi:hypothetical protein